MNCSQHNNRKINYKITELKNTFIIEIKILAKKAVQKLETVKPLTIDETNIIIRAFRTNKKIPKVTTVRGKVNKTNIGLIMALTKPNKRAEIINDDVSAKRKPLKTALLTQSDSEIIIQCNKKSARLPNIIVLTPK
jgi:hypothetical protein